MMGPVWFSLIALMLTVYVVLDGFDLGVGILHLRVARTDAERRTVLASIGPVWDGNEVWLIASGGILVFAFPRAYATGLSGFYLPLCMALWLLVLRGLAIEFRSLQENPLWRSFWDGTFSISSGLLAIVLGAALGNVIRGVPVDETGFFAGPLFTDFRTGRHPGVLDWYTVLVGLFTLCALTGHGALYLVWKTAGPVRERSRALALRLWICALALLLLATAATARVRPGLYANILERPWSWLLAAGVGAGIVLVFMLLRRGRELAAFLSSVLFLASLLAATAAGTFPRLLVSTLDQRFDLTVENASNGAAALRLGLVWWLPAIGLAILYFWYLFRSFRGKVAPEEGGHGY